MLFDRLVDRTTHATDVISGCMELPSLFWTALPLEPLPLWTMLPLKLPLWTMSSVSHTEHFNYTAAWWQVMSDVDNIRTHNTM